MLRNPESIFRAIEILRSFKFLPLNNLQTRLIHGSTRHPPPFNKAYSWFYTPPSSLGMCGPYRTHVGLNMYHLSFEGKVTS